MSDYVIFDVRDYGAVGDGVVDDGAAIQAALDAARDHGGSTKVVLEGGKFLSNSEIFVHDHSHLHIDEGAELVKGYVSGAANAFIRTEPVPRGLDDPENGISNGLKLVENVTITGGGEITLKSKALDGTGSYGPILLVAGSNWNVSDITIDGYYATPKLTPDGELMYSDRPEQDYLSEPNGNAIAILVVGDDHVLTDLNILDGSHAYGTTGIRIFSGSDIYVSDTYIESGDDMIATAPVAKYDFRFGEDAYNRSPLNQGDIDGVHFHNISGYSSAARTFAAIDGHAPKLGSSWGNSVSNVTITEMNATSYKSNHGLIIANYLDDEEDSVNDGADGLLSGFSIIDSSLSMSSLVGLDPYEHARGLLIQNVEGVQITNLEISGEISRDVHLLNVDAQYETEEGLSARSISLDIPGGSGSSDFQPYLHAIYEAEKLLKSLVDDAPVYGWDEDDTGSLEAVDGAGPSSASPATSEELLVLGLYDSETNKLIQELKAGSTILEEDIAGRSVTIAATISEGTALHGVVDSVHLDLNGGEVTRTENVEPFALFGDLSGDFFDGSIPAGKNSLTLSLYSEDGLGGDLLDTLEIDFDVVPSDPGFVLGLYDADTNELITDLREGSVVDHELVDGRSLAIAATLAEEGDLHDVVESVHLDLNDGLFARTENVEPYALFGDIAGDFHDGDLSTGDHKLLLSFYSEDGRGGELVDSFQFNFQILDDIV